MNSFSLFTIPLKYEVYLMIIHFACKDTQELFQGARIVRFISCEKQAMRKLQQLNAAASIKFLNKLPNNKLDILENDEDGQYSININDEWVLNFTWKHNAAVNVKLLERHGGGNEQRL